MHRFQMDVNNTEKYQEPLHYGFCIKYNACCWHMPLRDGTGANHKHIPLGVIDFDLCIHLNDDPILV